MKEIILIIIIIAQDHKRIQELETGIVPEMFWELWELMLETGGARWVQRRSRRTRYATTYEVGKQNALFTPLPNYWDVTTLFLCKGKVTTTHVRPSHLARPLCPWQPGPSPSCASSSQTGS